VFGEAVEAGAIGVDEVDVGELEDLPAALGVGQVAAAIGGEGDPLAVGRPGGTEVAAVAGGERRGFARGDVERPEVG
jgi:hypothetical protein